MAEVVTPEVTPAPQKKTRAEEIKELLDVLNTQKEDNRPEWQKGFEAVTTGLEKGLTGVAKGIRLAYGEDMAGDRLGEYLAQMRGDEEKQRENANMQFLKTIILTQALGDIFKDKGETTDVKATEPLKPEENKGGPGYKTVTYISPSKDLYEDVIVGLDRNMVDAFGPLAGMGLYNARMRG